MAVAFACHQSQQSQCQSDKKEILSKFKDLANKYGEREDEYNPKHATKNLTLRPGHEVWSFFPARE